MTVSLTSKQMTLPGFNRSSASLIGAMALGLMLQACAQSGFVDEGSDRVVEDDNFAKSMLITMGAIEDPNVEPLKFQPRPPLVVPPKRTLPQPGDQDAALAAKNFPVDPEEAAKNERLARLKGNRTTGINNVPLTPDEQAQYSNLPIAARPTTPPVIERNDDAARPLKPWELDGKAQSEAVARLENTGQRGREKALTTPPDDYRTPSSKAPLQSPPTGIALAKPAWWPF